MKAKNKEVVVKQTVYVAEDGHEFDSEKQCITYEEAIKEERCYDIAEKLPHFRYAPPTADYDKDSVWSYCENMEQLEAVTVKYLPSEERERFGETELAEFPLPCWVLTASDDGGYGFITGADRELEAFEKFVAEVRKLMKNGGDET